MPIDLEELNEISPFLYHQTRRNSIERIRRLQLLQSSALLMELGEQHNLLRQKRDELETFNIREDVIQLTDQKPINEANIDFQGGWTMPNLIEAINRHVFFWRGPEEGLLKKDLGLFHRQKADGHDLVFLRMPLLETVSLNRERGPKLCKFNSGSARQSDGEKIPRGPGTFVLPSEAPFLRGIVREVVFQDFVQLPPTTQCCDGTPLGPWSDFLPPPPAAPTFNPPNSSVDGENGPIAPDLASVIDAWDTLPTDTRKAILAIVEAVTPQSPDPSPGVQPAGSASLGHTSGNTTPKSSSSREQAPPETVAPTGFAK